MMLVHLGGKKMGDAVKTDIVSVSVLVIHPDAYDSFRADQGIVAEPGFAIGLGYQLLGTPAGLVLDRPGSLVLC